jgi:hypothetical protein
MSLPSAPPPRLHRRDSLVVREAVNGSDWVRDVVDTEANNDTVGLAVAGLMVRDMHLRFNVFSAAAVAAAEGLEVSELQHPSDLAAGGGAAAVIAEEDLVAAGLASPSAADGDSGGGAKSAAPRRRGTAEQWVAHASCMCSDVLGVAGGQISLPLTDLSGNEVGLIRIRLAAIKRGRSEEGLTRLSRWYGFFNIANERLLVEETLRESPYVFDVPAKLVAMILLVRRAELARAEAALQQCRAALHGEQRRSRSRAGHSRPFALLAEDDGGAGEVPPGDLPAAWGVTSRRGGHEASGVGMFEELQVRVCARVLCARDSVCVCACLLF